MHRRFDLGNHEGQKQFLQDKPEARFRAAIAGVQGGKTQIGCIAIRLDVQNPKYQGDKFIIAAPTYKMLGMVTKPTFESLIDPNYIVKRDERIEHKWITRDRKTIFFRSTENPDTLRGPTVRSILLDEASYMPKKAKDIAVQRIAVQKGRLYITTTPRGNNWLFQDIWKHRDREDTLCVKWRSVDNPAFPNEEYERIKATSDETWFKQEYDAEFVGFSGLVFPEFEYDKVVGDYPFRDDLPVYWGVDFGIANPTYVSYFQIHPREKGEGEEKEPLVVLFDELWMQGFPFPVVLERALEKYPKKPEFAACDPMGRARDMITGYSALDVLYQYGVVARYKKDWNVAKQRMVGIRELHKLLKEDRFRINRRCYHAVNAFEGYSYGTPKEGRPADEMPVKDGITDHPMESCIYFILAMPLYIYQDTELPEWEPSSIWTGF